MTAVNPQPERVACPECGERTVVASVSLSADEIPVRDFIEAGGETRRGLARLAIRINEDDLFTNDIDVDDLGCTECEWEGAGIEVELT